MTPETPEEDLLEEDLAEEAPEEEAEEEETDADNGVGEEDIVIEALVPDEMPTSVRVNGNELDDNQYSIDNDNNISISPEYIATLPDGEYTVTIAYEDATYEAVMLVDGGVPLSMTSFTEVAGSWSLFDLIMTVITGLIALGYLVIRPKKEEEESQENEEDPEEKRKRRIFTTGLLFLITIADIIFLLITQDFSQPMTIFDKYSVIFTVVVVIQIIVAFLMKKKISEDNEKIQGRA